MVKYNARHDPKMKAEKFRQQNFSMGEKTRTMKREIICPWNKTMGLIQVYIGDNAGLIPDHCNKANFTWKGVTLTFHFPMHVKVMFTLHYSLLSEQ